MVNPRTASQVAALVLSTAAVVEVVQAFADPENLRSALFAALLTIMAVGAWLAALAVTHHAQLLRRLEERDEEIDTAHLVHEVEHRERGR